MNRADSSLRRTIPGLSNSPLAAGAGRAIAESEALNVREPSVAPASADAAHFRAQSRKAVSMPGALRIAVVADTDREVNWSRDVRVLDLGLGGACVESADSVPAGTVVELLVDAPNFWDPMALSGAVAWERTVGKHVRIGICFDHAAGASVRALTELLEAEAFV